MTAALIIIHPDGIVVLSDSRRMAGGRVDSDDSQKVFKVNSQMVLLHVGWVGIRGDEVNLFAERFRRDAGEKTLRSAAWLLKDNVNVLWENIPRDEASKFMLVGRENGLFGFYKVSMLSHKRVVIESYFTKQAGADTVYHAFGDGSFQNMITAGAWFDNLKSLEDVRSRGEFLINEARSWVETCKNLPTFGGKIQTASIDVTGKLTLFG
jgi:hypothetical protein